jgi:hypothetical protein
MAHIERQGRDVDHPRGGRVSELGIGSWQQRLLYDVPAAHYARRVQVLVVDGANVVGSRPTGWWRDRAGAARRLHRAIGAAGLEYDAVVLVLEGRARGGQPVGVDGKVHTVHAPESGDDEIVDQARARTEVGDDVLVVTADRALRDRVAAAGCSCVGPSWLLDQLS